MGKRTNTAVWSDKLSRWQINVQKDGKRRSFYSGTSGRVGQRECNAKADSWLDDGIDGGRLGNCVVLVYNDVLLPDVTKPKNRRAGAVQSLPEAYIKSLVGHSKSMDTSTYIHDMDDTQHKIASAVDAIFTAILLPKSEASQGAK